MSAGRAFTINRCNSVALENLFGVVSRTPNQHVGNYACLVIKHYANRCFIVDLIALCNMSNRLVIAQELFADITLGQAN